MGWERCVTPWRSDAILLSSHATQGRCLSPPSSPRPRATRFAPHLLGVRLRLRLRLRLRVRVRVRVRVRLTVEPEPEPEPEPNPTPTPERGVTGFCWLTPGEKFPGQHPSRAHPWPDGAFAYF